MGSFPSEPTRTGGSSTVWPSRVCGPIGTERISAPSLTSSSCSHFPMRCTSGLAGQCNTRVSSSTERLAGAGEEGLTCTKHRPRRTGSRRPRPSERSACPGCPGSTWRTVFFARRCTIQPTCLMKAEARARLCAAVKASVLQSVETHVDGMANLLTSAMQAGLWKTSSRLSAATCKWGINLGATLQQHITVAAGERSLFQHYSVRDVTSPAAQGKLSSLETRSVKRAQEPGGITSKASSVKADKIATYVQRQRSLRRKKGYTI